MRSNHLAQARAWMAGTSRDGIPVLTNTPFRGPQRGPGENQTALAMEPILDKAAHQLSIDRLAIRMINAPDSDGRHRAKRESLSSAYLKEAL
jgi:CO/xanthine dehydrogenase Mo-binding subunit